MKLSEKVKDKKRKREIRFAIRRLKALGCIGDYFVYVYDNDKLYTLGLYQTEEEASKVYNEFLDKIRNNNYDSSM